MIIEGATTLLQAESTKWRAESYVFELLCVAEDKNKKHAEFGPVKDYWMRSGLHWTSGPEATSMPVLPACSTAHPRQNWRALRDHNQHQPRRHFQWQNYCH